MLYWYRPCFAIVCSAAVPEEDPNAEPVHWLEVEQAKRQVYCQHFSLPHGVVQPAQQPPKKRVKQLSFILFFLCAAVIYVEDKYTNKCCPIMYFSIVL